ncbi:MAG TPA: IS1182 family transposase [Nocardioidaceae bacterium]|nr:IS1182 family transposase [Nocardioidaceae bacterium]
MTLGLAERQGDLLDDLNRFCELAIPQTSVYALLNRERDRLFPDEMFADLFSDRGRRSVPPCVVATVMVLQRLEGLSDREAVDRYAFDARWRYAAGVGGYDGDGWAQFAHTVLVDMRARLAASKDPRRVFRVALDAASAAGLVGAKRVLDSTPLYDAVATMDTITLIRSAIRALLKAAGPELAAELRAVLSSGDEYASNSKPQVDWDDSAARAELIDSRARDGYALLRVLDGRTLDTGLAEAAALLATVLGQDLQTTEGGAFRIARRVAKDRVISTVDPQARHGHKTQARGFDGYKGHVAADPDSEIITDTEVSAGNVGDAAVAADLIGDLLDRVPGDAGDGGDAGDVYGDAAYGSGEFQGTLAEAGIESHCKTQPPNAPAGRFAKDQFDIDLARDTVSCPNGQSARIRRGKDGDGTAYFGPACNDCPLRAQCTDAREGRTVAVGRYEQRLADARQQQKDPAWVADYRATRPKVERKLGHLMRRKHGGRRARMRGKIKIDADFNLLAAAHNLARLAVLNIHSTTTGWAAATA